MHPTKQQIINAFKVAAEKYPGFTPRRNRTHHYERDLCGCALVALYIAAGEPDRNTFDCSRVYSWFDSVYGGPTRWLVTSGFDSTETFSGEYENQPAYQEAAAAAKELFGE